MIAGLLLAVSAWTAPVTLAEPGRRWAAAPLPGWLERRTGGDLSRVRLLDGAGREVPYRVLDAATDLATPWRTIAPHNLRRTATGFAASLELPPDAPVDAVEIGTRGDGGVLSVEIRGGTPPGVLVSDARIGRLQGLEVHTVKLPVTDVPSLDIVVTALVAGLEPTTFRVHRTARPKRSRGAVVRFRAARIPGDGDTDRWRLAAQGDDVERIDGLVLEITSPAVLRRRATVTTVATGDHEPPRHLGGGEIARLPLADGRRGIEVLRLGVRPGAWQSLDLAIDRQGEAPVELAGAVGDTARRWLVFAPPGSAAGLHLTTGDRPRSDSLERGPLPVLPDHAAGADIGPPEITPATPTATPPAAPSPAVSLLFIVVAALLALLAWSVLRSR